MFLLLKPNHIIYRLSKTVILSILIICSTWFQSLEDYLLFASDDKQVEIYGKRIFIKKNKKSGLKKNRSYLYKISKNNDTFGLKKIKKRKNKIVQQSDTDKQEQKYSEPHIHQENDTKIIERIGSIIALIGKMEKKSENKSENINKVPSRSVIDGISIGKISYVILSNGDKIFKGGKLDNGCIVEDIRQKYILLNCNGYKKKKIL